MIWFLYIPFIIPVLGVFYGTSLIADEVDDKTITYLFVRPIPRGAVLIGKYLAYVVCTTLLVLPSVVLVYFLFVPIGGGSIGAAFPALVTDLGLLALGLAFVRGLVCLGRRPAQTTSGDRPGLHLRLGAGRPAVSRATSSVPRSRITSRGWCPMRCRRIPP